MTYSEKIINAETGEETFREYTAEEIAEVEKSKAQAIIDNEKFLAEQATKNATRQAVLDKLGLSADEIAALLG
jgi:hypothetical protein